MLRRIKYAIPSLFNLLQSLYEKSKLHLVLDDEQARTPDLRCKVII